LSGLQSPERGNHADGRLPFLLRLPALRRAPEAKGRGLLRVLQIRQRALSADAELERLLQVT